MSDILIVGIADIKVGTAPATIQTNLGSCIAVCLYDEHNKCGGMLHYMLADSQKFKNSSQMKLEKFADTGIPLLIKKLKAMKPAQTAWQLKAKIFGGAKVLQHVSTDIGKDNIDKAKSLLREYQIPLLKEKVGGIKGYKVHFDLSSGLVKCQIFGEKEELF